MKSWWCLVFFSFLCRPLFAQDSICQVSDFDIDVLGNFYIVANAEIIKYDTHDVVVNRTSSHENGVPNTIDARDPLRLLVFYRDFGIVSVLDNQLAEQSRIDLRAIGFADPMILAGSVDQGIWIFDRTTSQLIKLDPGLSKALITVDLRLLLNRTITPTLLEVSKNWVVMQDENNLLIFDQYGTYNRSIPAKNAAITLQFKNDDELWIADAEGVKSMNLHLLGSEKSVPILLPARLKKARFSAVGNWFQRLDGCLLLPAQNEIK